ncbi:UvrD-helicase domain-containing protein [Edaphobacter albus]|uniref:UvrD-helicase domain-containing protein n=1 Tax=Edaphobacter sp. 4G125 TaxID=2763071 RepID=UPI0016489FD5|nr:UvrD-helicase domain-containing protein [Edaphobacter sp. 4G125]QNI35550.1 UvrD-helicase domain-containing protein [Edaphobacter sp. 4G125]
MKKRPPTSQMGELFVFPLEPEEQELSSLDPPDRLERERALDITRSWIVEAPAGSGKTGLLIQRYLKLLGLPEVEQPEQVLAITFTLKAAGEIRERILKQLELASSPGQPQTGFERETRAFALTVLERDRKLGWGLLEHSRRLNIRTIDSVCAEIARSLPILSGSGSLSPSEDASSLYKLAAERTLMQLGRKDAALSNALRLVLLHRDGNLAQVQDLLAEMLSLRDQWARLIPLGPQLQDEAFLDGPVLQQIERTLEEAICIELAKLADIFPSMLLQDLASIAGELGNNPSTNDDASPIRICANVYHAPAKAATDLDHWKAIAHLLLKKDDQWRSRFSRTDLRFEIDKVQAARLKEIVDQLQHRDDLREALKTVRTLPPPKYPEEQWKVAKALFRVLYRALAELQLVFSERGECDFIEPSLLARAALRRDGVAFETAIGTKLQHLLVDEMQDTSTSQYELIQLLTQGWDGHSQTVFLVGDPKQSIYLFRQARVEGFIRTMQQQCLGDLKLGTLRLTANFRSQRRLVEAFNVDFSHIFPHAIEAEHLEEAPYLPANPVRSPSEAVNSIVWHTQVISSGSSRDQKRSFRKRLLRIEAEEVRHIIEQWQSRPLPPDRSTPWKIAVLVRNREHLSRIIAELKHDRTSLPIPFRAVNIEPLAERPEILDLFALTRALLHPADRIAWLAVLRAPWCGLELADLHELIGGNEAQFSDTTIAECILHRSQSLSPEAQERVARVWPVLDSAIKLHSRLPLSEWIERTWRSLGGDAHLIPEQKTNARMYFELLDELEQRGTFSLRQLHTRLKSLFAESLASPGAVDLMTIHGAKGLEWDVVLVPGLERKSRNNRSRLLNWNEMISSNEDAARILLAPIIAKGAASESLNLWLHRIQRSREQAEYKRLFYVACTRAREELHLFASPEQKQNGEILQNYGSLLQAAWPAAESHFVDSHVQSKPLVAPVIPLPISEDSLVLPTLAASDAETNTSLLYRLPLSFAPASRFSTKGTARPAVPAFFPSMFQRPEGSFEARALGNATHLFLELLAQQLATGTIPQDLLEQLSGWSPRILAVVRSFGLSPRDVDRIAKQVHDALLLTLRDPAGLWVLGTHKEGFSERALIAWNEERSSVRLDRIFQAGAEPFAPGSDYLWIVDYKTTQYSGSDREQFFSHEREKYAPQLHAYTRILGNSKDSNRVRLGLYYPMLPGLTWWIPDGE